jgi:hypothetical protein
MVRDWNEAFRAWAKPPSDTEEQKAENAARVVREAIRDFHSLRDRKFVVYATGSYRNNTNIRSESDIDVAVVLRDAFYLEFPANGLPNRELLGYSDASYGLAEFRIDVGDALVHAFGSSGVTAGDKAYNAHENTYRMDADVAVFFEHRRFSGRQSPTGAWYYDEGVEMRPRSDPQRRIINWHEHHYREGVKRNDATGGRFKRVARILKNLREDLKENGSTAAAEVASSTASFLIECLAFNASDNCYNRKADTYYEDVKAVITELWNATKNGADGAALLEVNRMKPLFGTHQGWTRKQANDFLLLAWQHVGFQR